jgi:hypothetical protein
VDGGRRGKGDDREESGGRRDKTRAGGYERGAGGRWETGVRDVEVEEEMEEEMEEGTIHDTSYPPGIRRLNRTRRFSGCSDVADSIPRELWDDQFAPIRAAQSNTGNQANH